MNYHLDLHQIEHERRLRLAQQEQIADEMRQEQAQPNSALLMIADWLVEAGEQMREVAQPKSRQIAR